MPPTNAEASTGKKIALSGGRPPGEVYKSRENSRKRCPYSDEDERLDPDPIDVDPHLTRAVRIVADDLHMDAETMPVKEQRGEDDEGEPPERRVGTPKTILEKVLLRELSLSDVRQRSRWSSSTGLRAFGGATTRNGQPG